MGTFSTCASWALRSRETSRLPGWAVVASLVGAFSAIGSIGCDTDNDMPLSRVGDAREIQDGNFVVEIRVASTEPDGEEFRSTLAVEVHNRGIEARDVSVWITYGLSLPSLSDVRIERGLVALGDIARDARVTAEQRVEVVHKEADSFDIATFRARASGGVLLDGDSTRPARDALHRMSAISVPEDDIEDGLFLTRLEAWVAPAATTAEVNDALREVDARIVSMRSDSPALTLSVPRAQRAEDQYARRQTLEQSSGFDAVEVGRLPTTDALPYGDTSVAAFRHHYPLRTPAAWNLRDAVDLETCVPVLVVVYDRFSPPRPDSEDELNINPQPDPDRPGVSFSTNASTENNPHGFDMMHALGARYDDMGVVGTNPVAHDCVRMFGVDIRGMIFVDAVRRLTDELNALTQNNLRHAWDHFILNVSVGFQVCDPADETCLQNHGPYRRAREALAWKGLSHTRWDEMFIAASGGNKGVAAVSEVYPGFGEAKANYVTTWVTEPGPISLATDRSLWARADGMPPNLAANEAQEQALIELATDLGIQQVGNADNTLIVGGTTSPDAASAHTTEARPQSGRNADVYATGQDVLVSCNGNVCGESLGSSPATAQVAGLASYLWLLSDQLRIQPPSVTRRAILANVRDINGLPVVDAYAAALSLDNTIEQTPLSMPMRTTLLDVATDDSVTDGPRFDDEDIAEFRTHFFVSDGGAYTTDVRGRFVEVTPAMHDYSRYDLNGDGLTGGGGRARFDLDREGSQQFGPANYATAVRTIDGVDIEFNEESLTDLEILCYYAHSGLFDDHAGTTNRDALQCAEDRMDIIASSGPPPSGQEPNLQIGFGVSTNNEGSVAFVGRDRELNKETVFVRKDRRTSIVRYPILPPFEIEDYPQVNDRDQVVWVERARDGLVDHLQRYDNPIGGTSVAVGSRTPARLSPVVRLGHAPTLDNNGRVVFHAWLGRSWHIANGIRASLPFDYSAALPAGDLYPMTSDTGATVVRGGPRLSDPLLLFTEPDLSTAATYAGDPRFSGFGSRPGISDDGKFIAFAAETPTGLGVFAHGIVALSPPTFLDPLLTIADADDFEGISLVDRVAVNRIDADLPRYRVVYAARREDGPNDPVPGFYASDIVFSSPSEPPTVEPPRLLLEKGDSVLDLQGTVLNAFAHDPVSTTGEVVLWVQMTTREQAVVRITLARR